MPFFHRITPPPLPPPQNDDERSDRPRSAVNEENVKLVRESMNKKGSKSSLCYMEMDLNMSEDSIDRILTEFCIHLIWLHAIFI